MCVEIEQYVAGRIIELIAPVTVHTTVNGTDHGTVNLPNKAQGKLTGTVGIGKGSYDSVGLEMLIASAEAEMYNHQDQKTYKVLLPFNTFSLVSNSDNP